MVGEGGGAGYEEVVAVGEGFAEGGFGLLQRNAAEELELVQFGFKGLSGRHGGYRRATERPRR